MNDFINSHHSVYQLMCERKDPSITQEKYSAVNGTFFDYDDKDYCAIGLWPVESKVTKLKTREKLAVFSVFNPSILTGHPLNPLAPYCKGEAKDSATIEEKTLGIGDSDFLIEPSAAILLPLDNSQKIANMYIAGSFDKSQSFKHISLTGETRFFLPYELKSKDKSQNHNGAIEIEPRLHAMHTIMAKNFELLEDMDEEDIIAALECFNIKMGRFSKRIITSTNIINNAVKARRFCRIVNGYVESKRKR